MFSLLSVFVLYIINELYCLTRYDADAVRLLVVLYYLMAALDLLLECGQVVLKTSWRS